MSTEVWTPEQVISELHALRGHDEEAELARESILSMHKQLMLSYLYNDAPPVWQHPTFAAEFADAFLCGTSLEGNFPLSSHLNVSLLAMKCMAEEGSTAEPLLQLLPSDAKAAVHYAGSSLHDALELALQMDKAIKMRNATWYVGCIVRSICTLEPGCRLLIPAEVGAQPLMLVVTRDHAPSEDRCTFAIIANSASLLAFHASVSSPPKTKYETTLELLGVSRSKLCDEATWTMLWAITAGGAQGADSADAGKKAVDAPSMFYELLTSFVAEVSKLRPPEQQRPSHCPTITLSHYHIHPAPYHHLSQPAPHPILCRCLPYCSLRRHSRRRLRSPLSCGRQLARRLHSCARRAAPRLNRMASSATRYSTSSARVGSPHRNASWSACAFA